jgi:hypothetical protein
VESAGLRDSVIPCEAQCRVANGHVDEIKGKVRLHLSFKLLTREGKAEASCEFQVLEGLREELILGIRDILGNFRELFLDMLRQTSKPDALLFLEWYLQGRCPRLH